MRWLLVAVLAVPGVLAAHATPADVMHARGLANAVWQGPDGAAQDGVLGHGVAFFTVEDPSTLGHDDLASCYGKGYTMAAPAPPIEGPTPGISPFAGHGTWTAGAVCSTGAASAGHYRGLAPGSKVLFVSGILGDPNKGALQQELLDEFDPPVVTSSTIVFPPLAFLPLADGADVLVTWAAGNEGGNGSAALASDAQGDERILVVAATTWDGAAVADYSSRGDASDAATWPHIAAVGCHIVPIPRTQPGSANPFVKDVSGETPDGCRALGVDERLGLFTGSYQQVTGTSFAAPSVAAAALLMRQVHPAITTADLRVLLLNTTDLFLPTSDRDGDGNVTRHDFWLQHGFAAGHGLLNMTAAVTAAHYMALHGASAAEALVCAAAVTQDGVLHLNPGPRCTWPPPVPEPPALPVPAVATNASANGAAHAGQRKESSGAPTGGPAVPALAVVAALAVSRRLRHHR